MTNRILLVDDEQRILDGLRRTLRGRFTVETANSGAEGLEILQKSLTETHQIAVIVSDMMMPGMNGASFLTKAREVAPDSVRLILSGQADLTSTIAAVNDADLYRFLTKPVEPDILISALLSALRQYELVISERELLQRTLTGAV
ncbi:MAG: response regulator, partial [Kineosporiaceae bacterium]